MQTLAYRYRLLPTKTQHRALERILEDQRQLYNGALEDRIEWYRKTGTGRTYFDQTAALTLCRKTLPEMAALPLRIQRATLKRLEGAYSKFFRKNGHGFPHFKAQDRFNSFGFEEWKGLRLEGTRLRFMGLPGGLRIHLHRPLPTSKLLGCVFRRDIKGWIIIIQVQMSVPDKRPISRAIGVDLGLTTLAALSDGTLIRNIRPKRRASREMRRRQRQLTRCNKGSRRRRKIKQRLARLHSHTANTRATHLHQVSALLVRQFDMIAIEAINTKALARSRLARSMHDASWGMLVNLLHYKAERSGAHIITVNPRHTSQECPVCESTTPKDLNERVHQCPCGCILDRDVAAAKVILKRAVASPGFHNVAHAWGERETGNLGASQDATLSASPPGKLAVSPACHAQGVVLLLALNLRR